MSLQPADETEFSARRGHAVVSYNNQLWVIAGQAELGGFTLADGNGNISQQRFVLKTEDDVWRSDDDGVSWTRITDAAAFGPRKRPEVVVFNNKLWLVSGGEADPDTGNIAADVYSSTDGESWTLETADAGFVGRIAHDLTVHNGRLYISGGKTVHDEFDNDELTRTGALPGEMLDDIWSTADGVNWVRETAEAGFEPRAYHQMVSQGGALYVIAGKTYNYSTIVNGFPTLRDRADVWVSTDNGKTWLEETTAGPFVTRRRHSALAHDGKIQMFGGTSEDGSLVGTEDYLGDVWRLDFEWRQGFYGNGILQSF